MRTEGKIEDIYAGLTHKAALVRINGIMNAARFSVKTPEVVDLIKNLKNENTVFDIYSVSDFAAAALDLMGVEKYAGDKEEILVLIKSRFSFMDY